MRAHFQWNLSRGVGDIDFDMFDGARLLQQWVGAKFESIRCAAVCEYVISVHKRYAALDAR